MSPLVDLRSDTVTRPTDDVRRAMASAEVGDDVYGEDPTVNRLEEEVAGLLGHEAAVFTPTGSLANVLGVAALVGRGSELLCEADAHVVRAELGAHAVLAGVTTRTWSAERGLLDAEQPLRMMTAGAGQYVVSTAAIAVEDTHNFGGGTVQPLDQLRALRAGTAAAGVAVHLDGARLWNAAVATGVPLHELGACADTVAVCLSKGLGAPVGSLMASSAARVAEARVLRKRMGAGMRQVGVLAAAGLHVLRHHLDRLAEDHARAQSIALACADALPGSVDPALVDTNIVLLQLDGAPVDAAGLVARAREAGVLVSAFGPRTVRLVTHLDVDDAGARRAGDVLAGLLAGASAA